jgi:hypothetical protein
MTRTTPPRPADVAAVFPRLAPLSRTATRLHPRPGSPSVHGSSVGGPLLWPADAPWPHCEGPHVPSGRNPRAASVKDVRQWRRVQIAAAGRPRGGPRFTPEESSFIERFRAGTPWPEGPVPMLPVAKFYTRDIPGLRPPGKADLLQVLWCPFDHGRKPYPKPVTYWRETAKITSILADPPEPPSVQVEWYLPEPCTFHPEQITEYPDSWELGKDLREEIQQWCAEQFGRTAPDSSAEPPEVFYRKELAVSPGWKLGGWSSWGSTGPNSQFCSVCGVTMEPFLTINSAEWDSNSVTWIPYEDQGNADDPAYEGAAHRPSMLQISDMGRLQFYACPASPDYPYTEQVQ